MKIREVILRKVWVNVFQEQNAKRVKKLVRCVKEKRT